MALVLNWKSVLNGCKEAARQLESTAMGIVLAPQAAKVFPFAIEVLSDTTLPPGKELPLFAIASLAAAVATVGEPNDLVAFHESRRRKK